MSEPNDKTPSAPTKTDDSETAADEKNAPSETADRDTQDPDDEATVIEPPDPGFGPPAD